MNMRERDFWADRSVPRIAPERFHEIVATATDLAIVVDLEGIVQTLVVNPLNPGLGRLDHWEKRDIRDFLAEDSLGKLERQLMAYRVGETDNADSIEVNHQDTSDWEFPIRYTLHRTGDKDLILMLGRDLRPIAELQTRLVKAQQRLEQNYEAHRDFETRYRVLMDATQDPFVLIEPNSGRIVDANPAAGDVLGADVSALIGSAITAELSGYTPAEMLKKLSHATGREAHLPLSLLAKRTDAPVQITGSQFRAGGEVFALLRLQGPVDARTQGDSLPRFMQDLFASGADAMIVTDAFGTVLFANDAFLTLADIPQLSDVKGASLSLYLSRGNVDLRVLLDNAARKGAMPLYTTRLRSHVGREVPVELSATHLTDPKQEGYAFVMRDASRMDLSRGHGDMPAGMDATASKNVVDLVGNAPLKEIVAATADVVEKLCIETAVELTRNNRVAAAEMLGLSRQSLYVKLRKYGLLHKNGAGE